MKLRISAQRPSASGRGSAALRIAWRRRSTIGRMPKSRAQPEDRREFLTVRVLLAGAWLLVTAIAIVNLYLLAGPREFGWFGGRGMKPGHLFAPDTNLLSLSYLGQWVFPSLLGASIVVLAAIALRMASKLKTWIVLLVAAVAELLMMAASYLGLGGGVLLSKTGKNWNILFFDEVGALVQILAAIVFLVVILAVSIRRQRRTGLADAMIVSAEPDPV